MSDERIKQGVEILMILQVLLFIQGVYLLFTGSIWFGLFGVIANSAFFLVNLKTLENIKERSKSDS